MLATGHTKRQLCLAGLRMDSQPACRRSQMFYDDLQCSWKDSRMVLEIGVDMAPVVSQVKKLNWFYKVDGLKRFLNLQKSV